MRASTVRATACSRLQPDSAVLGQWYTLQATTADTDTKVRRLATSAETPATMMTARANLSPVPAWPPSDAWRTWSRMGAAMAAVGDGWEMARGHGGAQRGTMGVYRAHTQRLERSTAMVVLVAVVEAGDAVGRGKLPHTSSKPHDVDPRAFTHS